MPEAVALYREVLMSVEEHEKRKQFQTDTLPHLHTLHNLKEVLATRPPGVHPTLRDDQLGKQVSGQAPTQHCGMTSWENRLVDRHPPNTAG